MWSDLSVWLLSTCPQMTKSHTLWRTLCWRSTMSTTVFCTSEQVCVHVYVCVIQLFVMDIPTAEGLFSLWFHSLIAPHFSHFVIQSDSGNVCLVSLLNMGLFHAVTVFTFFYPLWWRDSDCGEQKGEKAESTHLSWRILRMLRWLTDYIPFKQFSQSSPPRHVNVNPSWPNIVLYVAAASLYVIRFSKGARQRQCSLWQRHA